MIELSAVSLFAGLPDKELAAIGRSLTEIRQPAGRQVVMAGATGAAFLVILEGEAEVELPGGADAPSARVTTTARWRSSMRRAAARP